tara:strand:+ start:681 stop:3821 length:3141 start_codon:yes stop_codon:yes gene_type:complete
MQNKSVRIKTTPGQDSNLNFEVNQDFDFLEILSLRISQDDLYNSFCANYGVLVGRVITNGGFGVPNAKISIFIPISDEDQKNELISELYPYKTVIDKNSEGYRYNLFLRDTTCSINTAIGTFPTKENLTSSDIEVEIFEKYYKYTTRTNSAGDYIIFGTPTGQQEVHIDVDLSDMGLISMRPYELMEQGFPEKLFDGRTKFRSSTNLDDLAQVKSQNKGIDIVPFWGDTDVCNFGISRADFDLGVDIIPTSIFMGSIFTDTKKNALSKRCNPKNDMGEQCELDTRAGVIDILRVTYDDFENPIGIEEFTPAEGNEVIDDNGAYAYTLPMYYDKVVTDEFGNLVKSYEPDKGISTKGKYRFKIKFEEATIIRKRTTASLLVPSLNRIHGGTLGTEQQRWTTDIAQYLDPNNVNNSNVPPGPKFGNKLGSQSPPPQDPNAPVPRTVESDLELDFHTFEWKQVYTLSQFMKKYKRGGNRFSFVGPKGTDECENNNYLPFTTAMKKASFMFAIISLFIKIIAFLIKFLIQLGNLRFCSYFRLSNNAKCRKLINAQPFKFIKEALTTLFPPPEDLVLPCGDSEYSISFECAGFDDCFCQGTGAVQTGSGTGSTPCCPKDNGGSCESTRCGSFNVIVPNEQNCPELDKLEQWKCCAIFQAARDFKAIKFTFFDAWLNGSAYLFPFKTTVKYKANGTTKSKFCGPGSSNYGGDNYVNFNFLNNYLEKTCSKGQCLILGPSIEPTDRNYVGGVSSSAGNTATNIEVPLNSPGIPNGAHDTNEFIYCNWMMSTKIVSLGPIEMCEDVFDEIATCITTNNNFLSNNSTTFCNIPDLRLGDKINPYTGDNLGDLSPYDLPAVYPSSGDLNPPYVIKVGTGGESGFDRQETTRKADETSYVDPTVVFLYIMRLENCKFKELFMRKANEYDGIECHEFELKNDYQALVREVCKIQNDIVTVPYQDNQGNFDFMQPEVWDITGIADTIDPNDTPGPFSIDTLLYNRYHPNQNISPTENPTNYNVINEVQVDPRTNMPYFYFGLRPGKSAINKFREKFIVQ